MKPKEIQELLNFLSESGLEEVNIETGDFKVSIKRSPEQQVIAQAAALAPVHYSLMIWGTFWGWLVFGQLPDGWTWFGTAIIVATGLYIIRREGRLAQRE